MFYLLYHSHKAGNFKLCRLVVFLCKSEEPEKKEHWLDGIGGRPMSFRDGLAGDSVKDNGSKAKFFEGVQVYPEDFLRVVVHQGGSLAQGFLNT